MDDRERKDAGDAGESVALTYLRSQGLRLIARNYRCKAGEIDLVMLDGATLAIIEVRYRSSAAFAPLPAGGPPGIRARTRSGRKDLRPDGRHGR